MRKENDRLLDLICKEYENKSEKYKNTQTEIVKNEQFNRQILKKEMEKLSLEGQNSFLKSKHAQMKELQEQDTLKNKREMDIKCQLLDLQILQKKKRILELESECKEEEVKLAQQDKDLAAMTEVLKSRIKSQIGTSVLDFQKKEGTLF